jgi:hypothetical protein
MEGRTEAGYKTWDRFHRHPKGDADLPHGPQGRGRTIHRARGQAINTKGSKRPVFWPSGATSAPCIAPPKSAEQATAAISAEKREVETEAQTAFASPPQG